MPHIAILLCTFNGGDYLAEQLDSIICQDYKDYSIWVSDDGSGDDTLEILSHYQEIMGVHRFAIYAGPRQGFSANFLSLTCRPEIQADYVAYADQDDVWESNKLSSALGQLEVQQVGVPALYCSRTHLIDDNGELIGLSPLFRKQPSFKNAIIQNIGGGNTMVMNQPAHVLLKTAGELDVVSHDWWVYIIVSGVGGVVIYDSWPSIKYRQHNNNIVGSNMGWLARMQRVKFLMSGRFSYWNTRNIKALDAIKELLTVDNQRVYNDFIQAREESLVLRLWKLKRSGIYRQTLVGNLGLFVAAVLNKV